MTSVEGWKKRKKARGGNKRKEGRRGEESEVSTAKISGKGDREAIIDLCHI